MKKPSVIIRSLLLALLMIPYLLVVLGVLSSYLTFYHKSSFQGEVVSSAQEELMVLTISTTEFENIKWTEACKEFEYQGKMYDVAKIESDGVSYLITCENDSLEDLFINWLKSASKSKTKAIPQVQFSESIVEFEFTAPIAKGQNTGGAVRHFYHSFPTEIVPPPPRA